MLFRKGGMETGSGFVSGGDLAFILERDAAGGHILMNVSYVLGILWPR